MTDSDKYMQNGYACMSQNNFAQAIEYFQAVLQSDPKNEEAKMCLYLAYTKQGKPQYAEQYRTNVEFGDPIPPLDASYVKWHKEQVIEKWKSIFKANSFLIPNGDLVDDSAIVSYQLILSSSKTSSPSKEKSNYFYLLHPLYSNKKRRVMPKLCGEMEVIIEKKKSNLIGTYDDFSIHSITRSSPFAWKPSADFAPEHLEDIRCDNQLEKVEYEYYQLWANHYLGLWQWEKWNPLANIKDTVGKKHVVMGVDEEMREIASQLNEESEQNGKEIFSFYEESLLEELTPQFQNKLWVKSFLMDDFQIGLCRINPLENKQGIYGNYLVSTMIVRDADKGDLASAVFGSYEGQELTLGGSFHVVMSHSDAKDGACIIM